jgi:3-hydroxyisobutyrate dehydrogenase
MRIGIAGTGRMGTAIARRLIEARHEVVVWNRTRARAREACDAGATWSPTPLALAADSAAAWKAACSSS